MTEFKKISSGLSLDATTPGRLKPHRTGRLSLTNADSGLTTTHKIQIKEKPTVSEQKVQISGDTLTTSDSQNTQPNLLAKRGISHAFPKWNKVIGVWEEKYPKLRQEIGEKFTEKKVGELSTKLQDVPESTTLLFKDKNITHIVLSEIGKGKFKTMQKVLDLEKGYFGVLATAHHPQATDELAKEFQISRDLADLGVEGIVKYRELTKTDGQTGVLMEWCDKGDFFNFIYESDSQPDIEQIFELLWKSGETFAKMHAVGMVHRDIKLENILVKSGENGLEARVGDLGMVTKSESSAGLAGTWELMAPELADETVTFGPKQDAWSYGAMLFGLLAGGDLLVGDELSQQMRSNEIDPDVFFNGVETRVKNMNWEEKIEDEGLRNAIKGLLDLDPQKRWTIEQALPALKRMSEI